MARPTLCWYCRQSLSWPQYRWIEIGENRRRPVHRNCRIVADRISTIVGVEDREVMYQLTLPVQ